MTYKHFIKIIFYFILLIAISSCSNSSNKSIEGPLFKKLLPEVTGINFVNTIIENESYNHILKDVVFNGGGVAVIDINNDGLQDLFFSGNMVDDKLYLNKGNLKFEDITKKAGIIQGSWSTGVTVADVNGDGFLDFYVGKFMLNEEDKRKNHLYINNGNLTFSEKAAEYGIDDNGHCTAVNFFDYNKDGFMDLYIGNQPFVSRHRKKTDLTIDKIKYTDRLFKNPGNGQKFVDVTHDAGISNYNFTLSATVGDLNNDGWPDIYIASDTEEPDYLYINNGDGTFTNTINYCMRHISYFSMGADIADFNNDGWLDIYCADMAPADNYRTKANMSGMNPEKFWGLANNGYHYQYMYNTLQLNNGNNTFSEIGQMAGVAQTDWSWSTLFADFDNDGYKDLFVSNGQPKDTQNKDHTHRLNIIIDSLANIFKERGESPAINSLELAMLTPTSKKLLNYLFLNQGNLNFLDKAEESGMDKESWTQGSVYVDLDNDGDLDLVTNNMNDTTFMYENRATQINKNNYLKLKLTGNHNHNMLSHGARANIYYGQKMQILEQSTNRGYMSSSDPVLHFGVGSITKLDSVVVNWLDGKSIHLKDVNVNQTLILNQKDGITERINKKKIVPYFNDIANQTNLDYFHVENLYDDYASEVLIPHRMSRLGPCAAVGDVNNDGLDDIYLGGAAGQSGFMYFQSANNTFVKNSDQSWNSDKSSEDVYSIFFDADNDKDLDLYVVSGGNEFKEGDKALQDRLYINDGLGNFAKGKLPEFLVSGGVAQAGDIDNDGDLDLFIGGRQVPNKYGYPANSFVFINENGNFLDKTAELAPQLSKAGMVTDAQWLDIDNDKDLDLIVVGEWMPITVFKNTNGKLSVETSDIGLNNSEGWWNKLVKADIDGDGDEDLIAGNLGLNIKFKASTERPFSVKVKDFDGNGSNDVYLAYYDKDGEVYPVRGRQCSSQQMPFIKEKFKTYNEFATASFDEVLGDLAEGAISHKAKLFESCYIENLGNGKFQIHKLPSEAQEAPIFGIIPFDWNNDGHQDLLVAGNYYEREVETTRSDAGIGTLLLGDSKGNFKAVSPSETGILAYLDVRALAKVFNDKNVPLVLILNNNFGMQVYEWNHKPEVQ